MVPSEALKNAYLNIEARVINFDALNFETNHLNGYYYFNLDISSIPQDAIVICEHSLDLAQLSDTDLNKDFFNRIYIDDTRKDTPNSIVFYALGDEAIPDILLTFRLIIFYKSEL